jgi:hypothetical protein
MSNASQLTNNASQLGSNKAYCVGYTAFFLLSPSQKNTIKQNTPQHKTKTKNIHKNMEVSTFALTAVVFLLTTLNPPCQAYDGILINGYGCGTQIYEPFRTPHARGDMYVGLQRGWPVKGNAAVINGHLAYFASGYLGTTAFSYLCFERTNDFQAHPSWSTTLVQAAHAHSPQW